MLRVQVLTDFDCTCRNLEKGNLVNWSMASFDLVNMTETEVSMDMVCVPAKPGHVIFPNFRNFSSHLETCQKFRGVISVVRNQKIQTQLGQELLRYPACHRIGRTENFLF